MGETRTEYEEQCKCGKGTRRIERTENDSVWGPHWERAKLLRGCPACGNKDEPKRDPQREREEYEEFMRRHRGR